MNAKNVLDQTINVRELQRLHLEPNDVLLVKLGVEHMTPEQIADYCNNVGRVLRENLPYTKMVVTTVTYDNPFDVEAIRQEVNEQ